MVAYSAESTPLFNSEMFTKPEVKARLNLNEKDGSSVNELTNLFVAKVEVENRGNRDFSSFKLGLTMNENDMVLYQSVTTPDRNHQAQPLTQVSPLSGTQEIDFILSPFNRKETYKFTLYFITAGTVEGPHEIAVSTPEPVDLKRSSNSGQLALIASQIALRIGPYRISIG